MTQAVLVRDGDVAIDTLVEGNGPAIVLLPSSQRDSRDFGELAALLADAGFCVLRPQPRGMGGSRGPMEDLSLDTLARDVVRVIDRLGAGRAIVAGHAFGHYTARVTDLNHSEKVLGIVVIAGAARVSAPELSRSLDSAADATQPEAQRLASLRHAFFAPGNDPTPWLDGWHPQLRDLYRRAGSRPAKDIWWPVSHAPILDLHGEHDPWRPPATREELRDTLGADKVTLRVIANASHAMIPEQPQAVAREIVAWAKRLQ